MAILVVVPNSILAFAILWLDPSYAVGSVRAADASILLEAQSGLMKGDYSVIDYSMQCGSFDVGASVPAACSSAASSVVPATVVVAFPFSSCGLALSAELRLYPVFCFQSWNVDYVICYLSPEMVSLWIFMCVSWTLHCFSWIQKWFLARLMAKHRCVPCYGARVGCSLCGGVLVKLGCFAEAAFEENGGQVNLQAAAAGATATSNHDAHAFLATSAGRAHEGLHCEVTQQAAAARAAAYIGHDAHAFLVTSEARALEGLHCVMALQAAAARAAAYFQLVALSCLATSVAEAFEYVSKVRGWQAAAAPAAAFFEGYTSTYFLVHMFESCWIFAGILLLGELIDCRHGEDTKKGELKGFRDFSIPQASIREAAHFECRFHVL